MSWSLYTISIALMVIFSSFLTRIIPFIIFAKKHEHPYIEYLGKVLPFASIGLLIVDCLKHTEIINKPYGIPELFAILTIVFLHWWKKNSLLSISGGTLIYMLCVQYKIYNFF
jgi:branched-subunit amino acid transport protein AzlD